MVVVSRPVATAGKKRGIKKGSKVVTRNTARDWYNACELFRSNAHSLNQTKFLKSDLSGDSFTGTRSEQQSFGRKLTEYDKGRLSSSMKKRIKKNEFEDVERMLVEYINRHAKKNNGEKCGLNWSVLASQSRLYATECGYTDDDFKASSGWIDNVLRRNVVEIDLADTISLNEAEESLYKVRQYIDQSDAPAKLSDTLLMVSDQLRAHNVSKQRNNPTIHAWLITTKK